MNVPSEESRASTFFDRYATDFDAIYGNDNKAIDRIINRLFRKSMVDRYEQSLAGCSPIEGKSVLDIGCGPGHYSVALATRGASRVVGLDFAPAMLDIARARATRAGVAARCSFEEGDFLTYSVSEPFDYGIVMGFMDYIKEPEKVIDRVVELIRGKAFFSFPTDGGVLAWQRRIRYRNRCDLYLYREAEVHRLMKRTGKKYSIRSLGRDLFVTLEPSVAG